MTTLIRERLNGADPSKLTFKQKIFVKELLADPGCSITNAARAAGYRNPSAAANKLMKNRRVAAIVGKETRLRGERLEFRADEVLDRLRVLLELDITEMFDSDGFTSMERLKGLSPIVRQCINKIRTWETKSIKDDGSVVSEVRVEVEWMSKDAALQLAMKHFNLLQTDINIHIATKQAKEQAVIDMLGAISESDSVIDAKAINHLAADY